MCRQGLRMIENSLITEKNLWCWNINQSITAWYVATVISSIFNNIFNYRSRIDNINRLFSNIFYIVYIVLSSIFNIFAACAATSEKVLIRLSLLNWDIASESLMSTADSLSSTDFRRQDWNPFKISFNWSIWLFGKVGTWVLEVSILSSERKSLSLHWQLDYLSPVYSFQLRGCTF